eukprot:GEMP01042470.1.p1 GENE.GEMP01042470.1~~GEMP01042470.1.p1  ORF type:complete len:100 (+),score=16.48 GEMP01042470.1:120-419(+)
MFFFDAIMDQVRVSSVNYAKSVCAVNNYSCPLLHLIHANDILGCAFGAVAMFVFLLMLSVMLGFEIALFAALRFKLTVMVYGWGDYKYPTYDGERPVVR